MRCWELIEAGHWPLWTNQRPGSMMTDQSEARSDDEDAFWWRVNIGVICYWVAHWLLVHTALCSQSAAVLQTQTNVPCMCCMLQSTWSLRHINKYTQPACDGHGTFVQRWEALMPDASRHHDVNTGTDAVAWPQMEITQRRGVWLMLLGGKMIFCWKFILLRVGALVLIDFILSRYFWRMKTLFVSRSNLISDLRCWV